MRVLVLGATGMLGHVLLERLHQGGRHDVRATARAEDGLDRLLPRALREQVVPGVDAERIQTVAAVLESFRPDVVVNCIGLVKQRPSAADPVAAISLNALFPHQLARLCAAVGGRLVHVSTDCVFDGAAGKYTENDIPDAVDLYGRTKVLGELAAADGITLRTSFIGHELRDRYGLVEWFLSQPGPVRGFTGAIFSGFPSVELARIIDEHVLARIDMRGVYHVSSSPVSKCDLLRLIAGQYGHGIEIVPDDGCRIDRTLDSSRFREATGYEPPALAELIGLMHAHFESSPCYRERGLQG